MRSAVRIALLLALAIGASVLATWAKSGTSDSVISTHAQLSRGGPG